MQRGHVGEVVGGVQGVERGVHGRREERVATQTSSAGHEVKSLECFLLVLESPLVGVRDRTLPVPADDEFH